MTDKNDMTQPDIQKVTALITRDTTRGREILVFTHADDGTTQIPAGTVDDGESPDDAVLRETTEETGLTAVRVVRKLGALWQTLPPNGWLALETHPLCVQPESAETVDGFTLRRGLFVFGEDVAGEWMRARYEEYGYDAATKTVLTHWMKVGWLPARILTNRVMRHFYHLTITEPTPDRWEALDPGDNGRIQDLHWELLDDGDAGVIPVQSWWLDRFRNELKQG